MDKRVRAFVECYAKANKGRKYILNNSFKRKKMIKELCNDLKNALIAGGNFDLVDTYAGLAQVVTYKTPDANENITTKRMPVSYDTNMGAECNVGRERDLVPNSAKNGIIYFEDNGGVQVLRHLSGGRKQYRATLVLVCWLNRKKSIGQTYGKITKAAYDEIRGKLKGQIPSEWYINLKAEPVRFRQDAGVFAKYTYDETVLQYLRPPFEYFAVDLNVTFIAGCDAPVVLNPQNC